MNRFTRLALKLGMPTALILTSLNPVGVNAVTYGNPVSDPLTTAPYVVSIWKSDAGDVQKAEFLCSGTLISSNVVLTAAHCTDFPKASFFVKTGAVALKQELPLYPATPWTGTRYDPKSISGDFGLLRLNIKINGIAFPSLANSSIAKQINSKTALTLMGWGTDQNDKLTDTLRFSKLSLQDNASKRAWGKYFNPKTMISAGKYIKNEGKWSGSCTGDSGGPLLAKLGGITYVAGITSWGAKDCRVEKPSVFTRVSYFQKDIKSGIKAVELLASSVNRLAPIELVTPSMQGGTTPGSLLTCNIGKWENTVDVNFEWISPSRMVGITSAETKIISADAGQEFKCRIVARSKSGDNGVSVVRTASKKLVKTLSIASPPVIGGLQNSEIVQPGTVARCEGWNWAEPVDSELIEWFTTALGNPTTPVNGKLIGSGKQLTLSAEILKSESGRHLVCQLTGMRDGFPSYLVASKFMAAPNAPVISDVVVKSSSLKSGSQATCSYISSTSGSSASYDWGYTGAGNAFTSFGGQTADFIQISPQVLKAASGQKLACKVTITNQGVSTSRVGTSYDIFESALESPKVTISLPSSFYSGSTASCSVPYNSKYTATTYEWGISNSSQSAAFTTGVLSRTSSFSLDSDTLIRSAGNFLTCVVNVENEIGKAQGFASAQVSQNAAPALPTLSAPSISKQTKENSSVSVAVLIPSVYEYNSATMEITLSMQGTNCDGNRINSLPTTLNCSGLLGNTSYSASLSIRYTANSQISPKQSQRLQFTTIDVTSAPSITLSNATQSVVANSAISNVIVNNSGGLVSASGYSISPSLPSGLTLNTNTGMISGTPTTAQTQRTYTITATGIGGTSTSTFTLTVTAAETSPAISLSNSNQSVTVNSAILSIVPTNTGGTVNSGGYSVSPSLPAGLILNSITGVVSGVPVNTQTQRTYSITASGPAGSSSSTFVITVTAPEPAPSITISNSSQTVTVNKAISSISVSNSGGAINSNGFSISPTLPAGLTFGIGTGAITGTPTTAQAQVSYTITAVGPGGTSTAIFTLTVLDTNAPVVVTNSVTLVAKVSASDAAQAVTFRATDEVGISDVFIQVLNSTGVPVGTYPATRISGTAIDGTYTSTYFYDPIFYPSGTYQVKVRIGNLNSKVLDWKLLGSIQVVAPADTQNPVVVPNSAVFSSPNARLGETIDISFQATDNRGVAATVIALMEGSGNSALWVGGTLVSGSVINGTYKGPMAIPSNFKVGGYLVCALAIDGANLRSANQCGSRAEYVQIGVLEVVDPNSIYVLTGWDASGLNGGEIPINRGGSWEIKTLDRSNTYVTSVVAKSDSGSIDIPANSFWKSRSESAPTYPDNWQAAFSVPSNAIPGSVYKIYWSIKQSNGKTGVYLGGGFIVSR